MRDKSHVNLNLLSNAVTITGDFSSYAKAYHETQPTRIY